MRISIKAKLAGGFGIMLVLTGLAGGVGYQRLIAADDAMRFVVERFEVQNRILAAKALAIRAVSNTCVTVIGTADERAWGQRQTALPAWVSAANVSRVELANALDTLIRAA